jgi:hypothetical protein
VIRVKQVKVSVVSDTEQELYKCVASKLRVKISDILNLRILKRSIDARHKDSVFFVYDVAVSLLNERVIRFNDDILKWSFEKYSFVPSGKEVLKTRPVIVGCGPCGLFCAYELAKNGYKPIVIDRGEDVDSRVNTVNEFWQNGKLCSNSNVQFGEGGAGTFSDGKLSTQIKDKCNRIDEVLNVFVSNGAPKNILYDFMPHIGTDLLRIVIKNMRNEIISMGGEFFYNSCLTDINVSDNRVQSIVINDDCVLECDVLVLAIGHSARDTFRMLHKRGFSIANKPFAVGFRVMHSQDMINYSQYGSFCKYLGPASYKLTYNCSNGRGVYSFCMCPGGYVVNASSEPNRLAINGMSNNSRESGVANSAIVVTVNENDYGNLLFDGVRFQEKLEECAYELGNGSIPIQKFGDYVNNVKSFDFGKILPMIKGNYTFANLNQLFNDEINNSIKEAFMYFNNRISGFSDNDVLLAGVETRTSSPIRIFRNEFFESNISGVYPAGEGCGYAGGIVSAAVDGIKVFESISSKYGC